MLMADHGLVLYGNAIMVNPDFAKANPKVVAGFVRATIKGTLDTIKDPDAAIKSVMKRNETGDENDRARPAADVAARQLRHAVGEGQRLRRRRHGAAGASRSTRSPLTYDFKNRPKAEDVFTSQYLPPVADRKL